MDVILHLVTLQKQGILAHLELRWIIRFDYKVSRFIRFHSLVAGPVQENEFTVLRF